jgi:hypothetical protein
LPSQFIRLIHPTRSIRPIALPRSLRNPRRRQLLTIAAVLHEIAFQPGDLTVEQIVRLVDQADKCIGDHRGVGVLEPPRRPLILLRSIRPISLIRPIRPIRPIAPPPDFPHSLSLGVIFSPLGKTPLAQEILIVE